MTVNFFDKLLREDEDEEKQPSSTNQSVADSENAQKLMDKISWWETLLLIGFLLAGLVYRLYFIFFVSAPENAGVGWYGDTYHHWQIAYLTKTVGLRHGFLRLWDLKGMEFFWGPLHPVLLIIMFAVSGSTNIVLARILSTIFGVSALYLLYLLARGYWGKHVGLAVLCFGALFPIAVFNDASGMLEPLGIFFLLLSIYLWQRWPLVSGLALSLAAMSRAEAWLFSVLIIGGLFRLKEAFQQRLLVVVGCSALLLLYMKYLLDYTGNAIYPVWWNYLANAQGVWAKGQDITLTELQLFMRPILIGIAGISLLALIWSWWRRPKSLLFLLLGWGNIFFLGAFMGLGHYLTGWEWWFPVIRFFVFPYMFLVTMVLAIFSDTDKKFVWLKRTIVWLLAVFLVGITQLTWYPIWQRFSETIPLWEASQAWGKQVGQNYTGGKILFPEHDPHFTYTTVEYGKIKGEWLIGQMFDPYFYLEDEPYANWGENRDKVLSWLKKEDIRLAIVRHDAERYQELFLREPELFEKLGTIEGSAYEIWRVKPELIEV